MEELDEAATSIDKPLKEIKYQEAASKHLKTSIDTKELLQAIKVGGRQGEIKGITINTSKAKEH